MKRVCTLRYAVLCLLATVALGLAAEPARANGDPASDVLTVQNYFLPYGPALSPALVRKLEAATTATELVRYPIKVALIGTPYDLGSVSQFYGRPQLYARFLGAELRYVYDGVLVVVMPNGFGVYHAGRSVATEEQLLPARIPLVPNAEGLVRTAFDAVLRLARASGHPISDKLLEEAAKVSKPPPSVTVHSTSGSPAPAATPGGVSSLTLALAALVSTATLAAFAFAALRWRRAGSRAA